MNATTNTLPRWAYLALALACVAMGLWASYITLEYFAHGAKALETDVALQGLAVAAALMFVASEMGAFTLAALLTERQLWARRWMLYGFAGAVLALEVCTIVAVQLALTSGADLAQSTVQVQEKDLRARITALEAGAAAKRADAEMQRAAGQITKAARSGDKATAEQAQTAALYDQLAQVQAQKRPTMISLMGEKSALAYAIARGILVSLGGLVFFGTAGALLRAARGGTLSVDAQLLALLHELRGTQGAAPARMAMQVPDTPAPVLAAPAAPAPAPALGSFKPVGSVAPKGASTGFSYGTKAALAGAAGVGLLAATAAPMAHSAPAVPAVPAPVVPVNVDTHVNDTPVIVDTPPPVIVDTPAPWQRTPRAPRSERGEIMDTGIGEHDGHRFRRALTLIKAGQARPSQDGLFKAVRASRPVADRYLGAWAKAGEIVPNPDGAGWILAPKTKGGSK